MNAFYINFVKMQCIFASQMEDIFSSFSLRIQKVSFEKCLKMTGNRL